VTRPRTGARSNNDDALAADSRIRASKLRLFGLWALCAKVAFVPLVFDPALDMPFVVSKALLSHGLAYLVAGAMLGLFVRFGSAFFVRSLLHLPVLAFVGVGGFATVFAADKVLALYGSHARMLGFGSLLDCTVLYFAVVLLVRTRAEAAAVLVSALVPASVVLAYETIQMLGKDPFRWAVDSVARPFSTLGHPTVLAQYLTVLAVGAFAAGLLLERLRWPIRVLLVSYAALLLLGSAATGTRSALLGLGASSVVLVAFVWRFHPSPRARAVTIIGALGAMVGLAVILLFTPIGARVAATVESSGAQDDEEVLARLEPSAAGRLALYEIGLDMVRERPILGYGPDNFVVGVPRYRPERAPDVVRQNAATSGHSWVNEVATSTGLVGLACFIAIALVAVILTFRGGFRPLAIAGVAMLAAFLGTGLTTVNELGTEWMFWASAGAVAASTAVGQSSPRAQIAPARGASHRRARPEGFRSSVGIVLVAMAGLLALTGLTALDASRSARASQESRLGGQPAQAVNLGLRATASDPARAEYWHILGLAYAATARWPEAVAAFDRASSLGPYDARYLGDLASAELILVQSGDVAARTKARELGEKTIQEDPNNPRAHLTRAVVMQVLGDLPEALRSVERALALDPGSTNDRLYVTAAQVMLDSGHASDAVSTARQGVAIFGLTNPSVAIRIELARGLVAGGQPLDAIRELDLALSIQPNNATLQRLKSQIQASLP
jgi:O-antigen ligase/tetratricopeptide (TPR) repeat protein